MKDLFRDSIGSSPSPPMYSRLTDCAGSIFDCGDYGMSWFCLRWSLLELWPDILILVCFACSRPTPDWKMTLYLNLYVKYWLHNYERYSLKRFAPEYTTYWFTPLWMPVITGLAVFCYKFWLHAMLDLWHRHCKSSWLLFFYAWLYKWSHSTCKLHMALCSTLPTFTNWVHGLWRCSYTTHGM